MSRPGPPGRDVLPGMPGRPSWRRYPLAGLAVRAVTVLAGLAVLAIPAGSDPVWTVLTVLGVLVAVGSPGQGGAGLALGSAVGGWFAAYGAHGSPPLAATAGYALALYLIHTSTALAAAVPLGGAACAPRCSVAGCAAAWSSWRWRPGWRRPATAVTARPAGLVQHAAAARAGWACWCWWACPVLLLHRSRG